MKALIIPFSKRFEKSLNNDQSFVDLSKTIRGRIWQQLQEYNDEFYYNPYPNNNWNEVTCVLERVESDLRKLWGSREFIISFLDGSQKKYNGLSGEYIELCEDAKIFDIIQYWYENIVGGNDVKHQFQIDINSILDQEHAGWIFASGHFYKIDSLFLTEAVLNKADELLVVGGYEGPLEEFVKAREHLDACEFKEAIDYAYMAFESTLKAITERFDGTSSDLVKYLPKDFFSKVPKKVDGDMRAKVWTALPALRHLLGGHGQGQTVLSPPREFAELAVHLSGAFIHFLIRRNIAIAPKQTDVPKPSITEITSEDDLPF